MFLMAAIEQLNRSISHIHVSAVLTCSPSQKPHFRWPRWHSAMSKLWRALNAPILHFPSFLDLSLLLMLTVLLHSHTKQGQISLVTLGEQMLGLCPFWGLCWMSGEGRTFFWILSFILLGCDHNCHVVSYDEPIT